jgi:hypothetical protein
MLGNADSAFLLISIISNILFTVIDSVCYFCGFRIFASQTASVSKPKESFEENLQLIYDALLFSRSAASTKAGDRRHQFIFRQIQ